MSIYTKTGDQGETSLLDKTRISKSDKRFDLLGCLDELNASIGLLRAYLQKWKDSARLSIYNDKFLNFHLRFLEIIQGAIFELGAELARSASIAESESSKLTPCKDFELLVKRLEIAIDVMEKDLPNLQNFILPGGSAGSAYAHICRTLTRRCERKFFSLPTEARSNNSIGKFLNRLSDYFFVLARFLNKQSNVKDKIWRK